MNIISILNIVVDKLQSAKLYSPIFGECELSSINALNNIRVIKDNFYYNFDEEGRYTADGECLLFPSKEMRDWNKYLWKKGDILTNGDEYCIFDHFPNDKYNTFIGKFVSNTLSPTKITLITEDWTKVEYQSSIDHYINSIEEKYGGNLNLETLEIEKKKKEYEFKPFDKVLCRDENYSTWEIDLFAYLLNESKYKYICLKHHWKQCIPYEGNEHLHNTSNNPE